MTTWSSVFWWIVLSGAGDAGKSNFGGFLNLSGIMQALASIISTRNGLGTTVRKGIDVSLLDFC